jgi:two-component system chemotaxis response regulator CheY
MSTILVVDDSPTIQRTLSFMLRRMGHTAITAENGVEALSKLTDAPVDIIISDINMPEMDGFTLLKSVRSQPSLHDIPIVLLTDSGEWQPMEIVKLADAFLTKPVSSHQLMSKIAALLP